MLRIQGKLNRSVEIYCGQLRNRVKLTRQYRFNGKKWEEIWDYPCIASACSEGHKIANAYCGKMTRANAVLLARLRTYGDIGKVPTRNMDSTIRGEIYPLGNCAEQHAASKILTRCNLSILDILLFGQSRQVRDNALRLPCCTCKNIFPQLR